MAPEQKEREHLRADGAHLGRGRSWVVLGVVLAVVFGLAVFRFGRDRPDTSLPPSPAPTASVSETSHLWPAGLPSGTLFVGSEGRVRAVDSRDGTLRRTRVAADSYETFVTPLGSGVLIWRSGQRARSIVTVEGAVRSATGGLRSASSFLPGPGGSVWAAGLERPERMTWHRVDASGRSSTSVTVEGSAAGDGAGGLLSVTSQGFRPAYPPSPHPREPGEVVATGPDGYVRRTCARSECRFTLHRHDEEPDLELSTAVGEDTTGGTLSPANRLLAVTETVAGTSTLRVSVVATGQILEIFDEPRGTTQDAVWLDDRWLALLSEDQLMFYDARDDRVVVPAVPLASLGPLAWVPA